MSPMPASRRVTVLTALWTAVRRHGSGPSLAARVRALPAMTRDVAAGRFTGVGRGRLAAVVAALVYLVLPVDLVPELLVGPVGLLDDAVVVAWLAAALLDSTERYLAWRADPASAPGSAGTPATGQRGTLTIPTSAEPVVR